ncbi:UPF0147 family protein [Candidatus Woesearchaeota archaeon]|nr:MAG: hypothetical protein QS99_C0005G0065 [archaeon GW2011_AR4]MBS3129588.1 UPF0147 family protein [Candidatus Woesearchaeota archaeon]HIH38218.1 hypothetical protein [Candidatus Woesearchaeota archaeon]HIH49695.1 hypothetical protein [Candidatus Woesearchaeota archaeon]HIJ03189.1 hypothetical protein [Candidatus Woesearchaeota archaeon]
MDEVQAILEMIDDLVDDSTVPKNVKGKLLETKAILEEKSDSSMKVNRALQLLEEVTNDNNMQAYTRTQIWNVVSLLEKLT